MHSALLNSASTKMTVMINGFLGLYRHNLLAKIAQSLASILPHFRTPRLSRDHLYQAFPRPGIGAPRTIKELAELAFPQNRLAPTNWILSTNH